jgi:Flp pilus assembly protein protease CpaA
MHEVLIQLLLLLAALIADLSFVASLICSNQVFSDIVALFVIRAPVVKLWLNQLSSYGN